MGNFEAEAGHFGTPVGHFGTLMECLGSSNLVDRRGGGGGGWSIRFVI